MSNISFQENEKIVSFTWESYKHNCNENKLEKKEKQRSYSGVHEKKSIEESRKSRIICKEGITYETHVDINNNTDDCIIEIPLPLTKPIQTPIAAGQYAFVYFDLETTGLGKNHINIKCISCFYFSDKDCEETHIMSLI